MEITVDQMYQIENKGHDMGFLKKFMMENAGAAAVRRLITNFENISSKNILIFVGLGNNGGDGLVMARHLAGYGSNVTVMLLGDPEKIKTEESNWNWSILEKMPSVKLLSGNSLDFNFKPDIVIDGILGTGISGEIREPYASAINFINSTDCYKFAVDVPSGLDPQTGNTANIFTKCDMTVTFHKMKEGIPKRKDLTGELYAEKIGSVDSKNIIIFVGMGNNGGDGQVMARHLAGHNANVTVVLLGTPDKIKTEESSWNWSLLEKMPSVKLITGNSTNFDFKPDIIIDGILGTGIKGDIREPYASAINFINQTDCYKFAVDVPSGMDPQTGETALLFTKCDMTVTFHKMKQGIPKRKDLTGELYAEKIGIPVEAEEGIL